MQRLYCSRRNRVKRNKGMTIPFVTVLLFESCHGILRLDDKGKYFCFSTYP